MDQWAPEDVDAHMRFLDGCTKMLRDSGEFVDAQALHPERVWVQYVRRRARCSAGDDGRALPGDE